MQYLKINNSNTNINYSSINSITNSNNNNNKLKCNVFETSCNITTLITGSGLLTLPFAAYCMGYSAIILLVIIASINIYTLLLISKCIDKLLSKQYNILNANELTVIDNTITSTSIDYIALGREAFGEYGDIIVGCLLSIELLLAIVSFFINISINFHIIFPNIYITIFIIISTIISMILSSFSMKYAAYSSLLGICMTTLIIIALIISSIQLNTNNDTRNYRLFNVSGMYISFGLIAFCFGGHGASPNIYQSMADGSKYYIALIYAGICVVIIYLLVMIIGYRTYAQFTEIPITLNIGESFLNSTNNIAINEELLRDMAAIGIIFNLQVTIPLVARPLRNILINLLKSYSRYSNSNLNTSQTTITWLIILVASYISIVFRSNFLHVCGFIGSVVTPINSMILPVLFYHSLHSHLPMYTYWIHSCILVFALVIGLIGLSII